MLIVVLIHLSSIHYYSSVLCDQDVDRCLGHLSSIHYYSSVLCDQDVDSCRLDSLVQTMQQINDEVDDDASEDESYDIIASQNAECKSDFQIHCDN